MTTTGTEDALMQKATEAVEILTGQDVYFQEAGSKFLVRELCWALVDGTAPKISPEELADHLGVMADNLRNHTPQRGKK